jgi:predicted secreted protein
VEISWENENWRRNDKSRIAAVAVYCIIVVLALFGAMVRYFVTQYQVHQVNAQLGTNSSKKNNLSRSCICHIIALMIIDFYFRISAAKKRTELLIANDQESRVHQKIVPYKDNL